MKYKLLFLSLIIVFIGLFISTSLFADIDFKHYNVQDGLPDDYVYAVVQAKDKFLWVGTRKGLSRFDGKKFKNYTTKDGLVEDEITSLAEDGKGVLWIGHGNGGVSTWNGFLFKKIKTAEKLLSPVVKIITTKSGVFVLRKNHGLEIIANDNHLLKENDRQVLYYDFAVVDDRIYLSTSEGIEEYAFKNNKLSLQSSPYFESVEFSPVKQLLVENNKLSLFVQGEGIYEYELGSTKQVSKKLFSTDYKMDDFYSIIRDENNDLLISCTPFKLLKLFRKDNLLHHPIGKEAELMDDLEDHVIYSLYKDHEGNIWAGTFGAGLYMISYQTFAEYKLGDKAVVNCLASDQRNNIYIGSSLGLYKASYNPSVNSHDLAKSEIKEFANASITALCSIKDSLILIGITEKGCWLFDTKTKKITALPIAEIQFSTIQYLLWNEKDNSLWISVGNQGVYHYDLLKKTYRKYSTENGFIHNEIRHIAIDRKGKVWMSMHTVGLCMMEGDKINYLTKDKKFPSRDVNQVFEDKSGNIWIATEDLGVFKYQGNEFVNYTKKSGLASDYATTVSEDEAGNIWVAHLNQFSKITKSGFVLTYLRKSEVGKESFTAYNTVKDQRGNLWFGKYGHLLKFNYEEYSKSVLLPETKLTNFIVNGKEVLLQKERMVFDYLNNQMTFSFSPIQFRNNDKMQFRYKLLGQDTAWSEVTPHTEMNYTNLSPGNYKFLVKARNAEGTWEKENQLIDFVIKPPFWQTWWFYALQLLFYGLLVVMIYVLRKYKASRVLISMITFILVFTIFEWMFILSEPFFDKYSLGIPIIQIFLNLLMALLLLPIERWINKMILAGRTSNTTTFVEN